MSTIFFDMTWTEGYTLRMTSTATKPRHPIRVVSQRTGLTPATLRAWERRYGVVEPERSEGGQRLYSDDDVLRLVRLRLLTEAGRSISSVAALTDDEAQALLEEDRDTVGSTGSSERPAADDPAEVIRRSVGYTLALDGVALEKELRRAAVTLGAHVFLEDVVAPLLHRIGSGWARGEVRPAHEHLCTAVVEGVLTWLREPVSSPSDAHRVLVTTLPGERHGLGAMLVATAAGLEGWQVTHLGTDLPPPDIAQAAVSVGARAVALSVVHVADPSATAKDLATLRGALPAETALILGGAGVEALKGRVLPPGTLVVRELARLRTSLEELA
jgi:DNA-binding transcriptional MerR regulator/methylmalonyl-CoA mutase cobalamin-binding subunit